LLIFTDQQRYDTLRAWGNPIIRTPALDRLAREGVLFDAAYTPSPVCVPARCALIHGQYASRTGCNDNGTAMPTDRPTFMQALTQAGYRTHGIGKMHFVPDSQALRGFQTRARSEEVRAQVVGDDYLEFLRASGCDHVYDPMGPRGEMYYVPQPAQMPARLHNTQWVGDRSVAFLESQRTGGQPFMLFTSFIHPHPPFSPPTPWNKLYRAPLMPLPKRPPDAANLHTYVNRVQNRYKYRDAGLDDNLLRCMKAHYYGCISFIDYQIGRILQTLEQRDLLDNTLILFTSDHGEFLGDYDCFGKRSMLDVAARIPMLARLPGRFSSGQRCDIPTSLVDVMPTLLSAADVDTHDMTLDGLDLAEVATGGPAFQDRTVYSQFQHGAEGLYMALNRRWKYAYSAPDRREYLFDREQDPQEMRNRAENVFCGQAADEMRARLMATYRAHGVTAPFDGEAWRLYPQPQVSRDPDAGLLIQDPGWSRAYQSIPGYSD
jgi:choline-sulfatase